MRLTADILLVSHLHFIYIEKVLIYIYINICFYK